MPTDIDAHSRFTTVQRLSEMTNDTARETIDLLLDVNNVYQQISHLNQLTEQTAWFYDKIADIVRPRADQVCTSDVNLPYHDWSSGQHTSGMNDSGPNQVLSTVSRPVAAGLFRRGLTDNLSHLIRTRSIPIGTAHCKTLSTGEILAVAYGRRKNGNPNSLIHPRLPDHFLPDVNDFDWLSCMPRNS